MSDLIENRTLINLRDFGKPVDAFAGLPDDLPETRIGSIIGVAENRVSRTNVDGNEFLGLGGEFELHRTKAKTIKGEDVFFVASRRLFLPNDFHDQLEAVVYPNKGDKDHKEQWTPRAVEFHADVYVARGGTWRIEYRHGPRPHDPLAQLRKLRDADERPTADEVHQAPQPRAGRREAAE